jgi:hypothetical protein
MAASLAKTVGMQLQVNQQQPLALLADDVIRNHVLTQPGPWDAGWLAVRVSSRKAGSSSSSSSTASPNSSGAGSSNLDGDEAGLLHSQEAKNAAACPASECLKAHCSQDGSQQQQLLQVELVAAFTSQSFAVGYLSNSERSTEAAPAVAPEEHVQVLRVAGSVHSAALDDGGLQWQKANCSVKCLEFSCHWPMTSV